MVAAAQNPEVPFAPGAAVRITSAERSFEAQHRARVRRYLLLMSFRIPALVIATGIYLATQDFWVPVIIIALSIPLPWVAVLIANDRPARPRGVAPRYRHGGAGSAGSAGRPAAVEGPVIEG